MKSIRLISIFYLLSSIFYLLATPLSAKDCSQTVDYPGPYSVLFESTHYGDDCSYPEDASPLDMDVIKNGRMTSQLVTLEAITHGDPAKIIPNGDGTLNITLNDLSTFGLGGDLLEQTETKDNLLKYRKTIEAYKNYDITHLYREAYAEGITTYDDFETWACDRDLCICNGVDCHLNPSVYSNASQLTPLKDQLREIVSVANQIITCHNNPNAGVSLQCSTEYPLPDGSSFDIAGIVASRLDPEDLIGSWSEFDDKLKFQAYSLHLTQSSPTFVLIVPQKETCTSITCILQQFFSPAEPGYIKAIIPETNNLKTGVVAENNRLTPLKDQTDSPRSSLPPKGGDLLNELLNQATTADPTCTNTPPTLSENLGASSTPVKNVNIITAIRNFFSSGSREEAQKAKKYCLYVFSPKDLADADQAMGADNNAMLRKLMPLNGATSAVPDFAADIDAPQALDSVQQGQTNGTATCLRYAVDPETGGRVCVEFDDDNNYVSYAGPGANSNQPAGKAPLTKKYLSFGIAEPLNSTSNIQDQSRCLVPWLAAGAQDFDFVSATHANNYPQSTCPNPLKTSNNPSSLSGDVCAIADQYQVDCGVLLAVWEIESGGASACVPNCLSDRSQCQLSCPDNYLALFNSCDLNSATAEGPLQIDRGSARVDANLNRCVLPDALALAAQVLVQNKNGGQPVTTADLSPVGRYQGCNNCAPSDQTQYRWGAGVSYCDAVSTFISSGSLPPTVLDPSFDRYGLQCYP